MVQSSVLRMESGNQTNYDSKWYKLYSTEWNMDEFLFNNKWPLFVFKSILFMRLYSSCVFKKENNPNLSLHVLKILKTMIANFFYCISFFCTKYWHCSLTNKITSYLSLQTFSDSRGSNVSICRKRSIHCLQNHFAIKIRFAKNTLLLLNQDLLKSDKNPSWIVKHCNNNGTWQCFSGITDNFGIKIMNGSKKLIF